MTAVSSSSSSSSATFVLFKRFSHWLRNRLYFVLQALPDTVRWAVQRLGVLRVLFIALAATLATHRYFAHRMSHQTWIPAPITTMSNVRTCPRPEYPTLLSSLSSTSSSSSSSSPRSNEASKTETKATKTTTTTTTITTSPQQPKICLTTLTDETNNKSFGLAKYLRWRNFDGLLAATWQNKLNYVHKHGYYLFDESATSLDKTRPPSWSKIKAVQRLLQHENCDWVFWMDADTVIMNSDIRIESFLPLPDAKGDLLIAHEGAKGYNAGAWIVRNSPWTLEFLQTWWNMKSYVKPPGLAKSGDNDALKALLSPQNERLSASSSKELIQDHVLVPPQCTFNAFAKWLKPGRQAKSIDLPSASWYQSEHWYHKGDFVAHVAGVDNKVETIHMLLEYAT